MNGKKLRKITKYFRKKSRKYSTKKNLFIKTKQSNMNPSTTSNNIFLDEFISFTKFIDSIITNYTDNNPAM